MTRIERRACTNTRKRPWPDDADQGRRFSTTEPRHSSIVYSAIESTSATNRLASSLSYEATTWNTASLKPPTFRMSSRSGACVDPYGWMSMQTSLGE